MPAGVLTTAKLTPEYQARLEKRIEDVKQGIEWDPISTCAPPGHPRWLTEPFLREFIVTPDQTWLINEMVNDIRRIYTDGRDHVPEDDRYPLYNGDSIGFWDGDKLVIHTNQLMAGHLPALESRLHRPGRDRGDLAQGRRQDADAPTCGSTTRRRSPSRGHVKQSYVKLSDPTRPAHPLLELRREPEQRRLPDQDGTTQFHDFTFTAQDDRSEASDETNA